MQQLSPLIFNVFRARREMDDTFIVTRDGTPIDTVRAADLKKAGFDISRDENGCIVVPIAVRKAFLTAARTTDNPDAISKIAHSIIRNKGAQMRAARRQVNLLLYGSNRAMAC